MALVRCPRHGVPYNDENPRGCPACALEREGTDRAAAIRELARASQALRRPAAGTAPRSAELPEVLGTGPSRPSVPVTTPPRLPVAEPTRLERAREFLRRYPVRAAGIPAAAALLVALLLRGGPRFVDEPSPMPWTGEVLPLPVEPGAPIAAAFAVLGTQPPEPSPEGSSLERHAYGTDLAIDALNGSVYLITLAVPNRSWHGLRVGMPEREAEGALALLGPVQPAGPPVVPRADTLRGLVVYASLEGRPNRPRKVEVRPPNGCYDVLVDIQPRASGSLVAGGRRFAAIGQAGSQAEWVVTRIRVIHRGVAGPAGPAAC